MGCMISPDPGIDKLHFYPFPTKPIKMVKTVRVGNIILSIDSHNKIYTNSKLAEKFCYGFGDWYWLQDVLKGLEKLGVITKEQIEAHTVPVKELAEKRELKYAQEQVDKAIKTFGKKIKINRKAASNV